MNRLLTPSVITSSTERSLADIISECHLIFGLEWIDLYVLRNIDILAIESPPRGVYLDTPRSPKPPLSAAVDNRTATEIMAVEKNKDEFRKWVLEQFRQANVSINMALGRKRSRKQHVQIAALATYYPEITSTNPDYRGLAIQALTNTVSLALELGCPIIEIVCGTVLDKDLTPPPKDSSAREPEEFIIVTDQNTKVRILLRSLNEVVEAVEVLHPNRTWCFALELEPGETYVLNNKAALDDLLRELAKAEFDRLRPHVGLNCDVAHMMIAKVPSAWFRENHKLVVHSHIADHPGMHSRDQPIGRWHSVDVYSTKDTSFYPYLSAIAQAFHQTSDRTLPFSGAVALELEGCNRISWIYESFVAMKRLFELLRNRSRIVPPPASIS